MSKSCVNCDNDALYEDGIARCPKCGNYLKLVNPYELINLQEIEINDSINQVDPYASLYDHVSDKKEKVKINNEHHFNNNEIPIVPNKNKKIAIDINQNNFKDQNTKHKVKDRMVGFLSSNKNKGPICEGIVKNFYEQDIHTFFVTKLFRSLFMGLPYIHSNTVNTFQIYTGWGIESGESVSSEEVILYGKIAKGKMPENNIVTVWGKRAKNGSIVAKNVKNETSQTYIKMNHGIHPIFIWLFVAVLVFFIYQLTQVNWGTVFTSIMNMIIMLIFAVFIFFIAIIIPIKSMFGKKK